MLQMYTKMNSTLNYWRTSLKWLQHTTSLEATSNCVINPEVDQSPLTKTTSKMRNATRELCVDLQLFDVWRTLHPKERDYTFFSHPHQSFSRIDYFFVSRMVLDRVEESTIGTHLLSDHADVSITVSPPPSNPHHATAD